ncbi:hypothetical protein QFC20_000874 [Naganishia adeliensis]|uniref:Uncharacterized protein n=1 Tax=Naganishia adeliensis TaxID=92952 RepID=A0ACC2WYF0_9TREE|nr:hypothetical protein QFC20_000874 [Naganishia adeliensis]
MANTPSEERESISETFCNDTSNNASFESAFAEAGDPLPIPVPRRRMISLRTLEILRRDSFLAFNDAPVNGPLERRLTAPSPPDTYVDTPQLDEDIPLNLPKTLSPLDNLLTDAQKAQGHEFVVLLLPNVVCIWTEGSGRLRFFPYSKAEPLVFPTSRLDTRGAVAYFKYINRHAENPEASWEPDEDPELETFLLKPGEPAVIGGTPAFDRKTGQWTNPTEDNDDQLTLPDTEPFPAAGDDPSLLDDFEDPDDSDGFEELDDSEDSDGDDSISLSSLEAELVTPPTSPPLGGETTNASFGSDAEAKNSSAVGIESNSTLLGVAAAKMERGIISEFIPALRREQESIETPNQRNSRPSRGSPRRLPLDKRVWLQGKNGSQHIHAVGQRTFLIKNESGKDDYVDFSNIMIATQVYLHRGARDRLADYLAKEGGWIAYKHTCKCYGRPRRLRESQSHFPFRTFISFAESNHAARAKEHLANKQKFEDFSLLRVEYHKPNKTLKEKFSMTMKNGDFGRFR